MNGKAVLILLLLASCSTRETPQVDPFAGYRAFANPTEVTISGYADHAMEPCLSPDGRWLFFNNDNAAPNPELHYAESQPNGSFVYRGLVTSANSTVLDGVPSLDTCHTLYWISTRSYFTDLRTVYTGQWNGSAVVNVRSTSGDITPTQVGWLIMDAEIAPHCNLLYYALGRFTGGSVPVEADLVVAQKLSDSSFTKLSNSQALLAAVNTSALEYAPSSSANGLELFFTRLPAGGDMPQIFWTVREGPDAAFQTPRLVAAADGFVEAPTLSADGNRMYYHKRVNGVFKIYRMSR